MKAFVASVPRLVNMEEVKQHKRHGKLPKIEVVDLFCGIGGLSYGMKSAGVKIVAGYDSDWTCQYAYETNTGGKFFYKDVRKVTGDEIQALYSKKKTPYEFLPVVLLVSHFHHMRSKRKKKTPISMIYFMNLED